MINAKDNNEYFEKYIGLIYYNIIKSFNISKIDNIVEFAPGFKCKIAYALEKLNYEGNLYIIDSNKNALEYVYNNYKEIIPKANIILINKDIVDSINFLPKKSSLFLANHCIDDLIISRYLKGDILDKAFDNNEESKKILIKCWNELKENDNKLKDIRKIVFNDMINFFNNIEFDLIIMSQYKSAYYMELKNYIEELSKVIFDELKTKIDIDYKLLKEALDFEFEDFSIALNKGFSLKENVQFYNNWIAGKYKKNQSKLNCTP